MLVGNSASNGKSGQAPGTAGKEPEMNRVLFPVRLVFLEVIREWELFDADEGKDLAVEIREYYIPDFSNWKNHDPYAKEFRKLLRDLNTEASKAA